MIAPTSIGAAARLRMLAEGLRETGESFATRAHMDIWPIGFVARHQLKRVRPDVESLARDLATAATHLHRELPASSPLRDVLAGVQELEAFARNGALERRASLRELATRSQQLAARIEQAVPESSIDARHLAAARERLFELLDGGAADVTTRRAKQLEGLLPPGLGGRRASDYLGLETSAHASEFVHSLEQAARLDASTFNRERLGLIELFGRRTPEADAQLRALALDIFSTPPKDLKAPAWNRLAAMLELDASGRVLDGPRTQGGSARSLEDVARRIVEMNETLASVTPGKVTGRYFDSWNEALRAHVDAAGAPLQPAGRDPNAERLLQLTTPAEEQLVQDLGKVGASNFADMQRALKYVDGRLTTVTGTLPPELDAMVSETRELVTRNDQRLAGIISDSFGRHPDYAELGRIRANMTLIELVLDQRAAAAEAADAAAPRGVQAAAREALAW